MILALDHLLNTIDGSYFVLVALAPVAVVIIAIPFLLRRPPKR